jgi:phage-related protein
VAGRKITVEFLGDSKDLENAIDSVDGKSSKLSGVLGKVGKAAAAGLAIGGAAAIAGGKHFFDLAATVEQMGQKADTVFGSQIGKVDKWAAANAHAMGLTRTQATGLAANFGDLLIPMGFTRKEAAKMSTDVVGLSGALSQWSGGTKSAAEVSEILSAAMLGETDGLKSLGISIGAADIEARLLAEGQGKLTGAARQQAEAQAIQALIMEKSTDAQKAFADGGSPLLSAQAQLKAKFGELQEMIATKLIPVFTQMADWFMTKGLPAIETFGGAMSDKLGPVLVVVGQKLMSVASFANANLIPALTGMAEWVGKNQDILLPLAAALGGAAAAISVMAGVVKVIALVTKAWAAVQTAMNVVLAANPIGIVIVALAALAAGLFVAWKKSETFRAIVLGSWDAIKSGTLTAFDAVKGAVVKAFDFIKNVFLNFTGPGLIIKHWDTIKSATTTAWNAIKAGVSAAIGAVVGAIQGLASIPGKVAGFFDQARESAVQKMQALVSFMAGIPGKILSGLGNLGTLLYNAGSAVIQGLIDGIMAKVAVLREKLESVTKLIPDWKGPLDKDKILLKPAGEALIEGLISGIEKKKTKLQTVLEKITEHIKKQQDKLASLLDKRQSIVDSFKGFASSVFGTDTATEDSPASAQKLVDFSGAQRGKAETLSADVKALIAKGMSKDMINQLIASGQSGMDQIHLLASATDEQIAAVNANNAATQAALTAAGLAAADAVMGEQIAQAERDVKLADDIRDKLAALLEKQDKNTVVQLILDGKVLHASLMKLKKAKNSKLELD